MVIEVVTLETNHLFSGNPIIEQHRLRYRSIIQRQSWDIPTIRDIEYDQYDNPATTYLIWRDDAGIARGVSRLYPTDRPFMLKEHFAHMATESSIPEGEKIIEGSRFCIDKDVPVLQRQTIARELIIAYLEYGLDHNVEQFIGIMYPIYWKHLFIDVGWQPVWFGEPVKTGDGKRSRAGAVAVSEAALNRAREISNITHTVCIYGTEEVKRYVKAA